MTSSMNPFLPLAVPTASAVVPQDAPEDQATSVTYVDLDDTRTPIVYRDVPIRPGETVDLADFLPKREAQRAAFKLLGNPFFQVEGGPDHQKLREEREDRQRDAEAARQEIAEGQARQAAGEPPADVKTPDKLTLASDAEENPNARRGSRTPPKRG